MDWSVMLIGVRNSLAIQAVNNIPRLFSGSSRKLSRDEALKNWLHLFKHLSWIENVLSNIYKLLPVFQSNQYYGVAHSHCVGGLE